MPFNGSLVIAYAHGEIYFVMQQTTQEEANYKAKGRERRSKVDTARFGRTLLLASTTTSTGLIRRHRLSRQGPPRSYAAILWGEE